MAGEYLAAVVMRSIVGRGACAGQRSVLVDAVVGNRSQISADGELLAGARLWPGTHLSDSATHFSPGR